MGDISFVLGISLTWGGGLWWGKHAFCYGDDCLGRGVFCFAFVLVTFVFDCATWLTGS